MQWVDAWLILEATGLNWSKEDRQRIEQRFLQPDQIKPPQFVRNLKCVYTIRTGIPYLGPFQPKIANEPSKSLQRILERIRGPEDTFDTWMTTSIYPDWFLAGYPDVVRWALDAADDDSTFPFPLEILESQHPTDFFKIDHRKREPVLRTLVDSYTTVNDLPLECVTVQRLE